MSAAFDYVIAGGGTAGCVLAARLSEDPRVRVLLLEAGPRDRNPLIHVPAGYLALHGRYGWGHISVPQAHCAGREIPLVQARVLGGGGSVNSQIFTRGCREDYDAWATTFGCDGWAFDDVLPVFVRSEANHRLSGPGHGTDGPIGVADPAGPHPLTEAWVRAGQEFGLPYAEDFAVGSPYGVGYYQTTTRGGRRCSAAVGYLRPALRRPNLRVLTGVTVRRVLIDRAAAVGVEFAGRGGRPAVVRAAREVIVTSGAYGSPKLLLLSGVGDGAELRRVGIDVRHELRGVGRNLHDHCRIDLVYELRRRRGISRFARPGPAALGAALAYLALRGGPLASTVVEGGAFARLHPAGPAPDGPAPDLQFHFLPGAGQERPGGVLGMGYGATVNCYAVRPQSRGTIRLRSADPADPPLIDPGYLAADADVDASIEGVRRAREIMAQPSMARHVRAEVWPAGTRPRTADDYVRFVRSTASSAFHPAGTCAMGSGEGSVVAPDLRVHGLAGLRVADSSVMPRLVSSNTQMATVMIAEKAADLIRNG